MSLAPCSPCDPTVAHSSYAPTPLGKTQEITVKHENLEATNTMILKCHAHLLDVRVLCMQLHGMQSHVWSPNLDRSQVVGVIDVKIPLTLLQDFGNKLLPRATLVQIILPGPNIRNKGCDTSLMAVKSSPGRPSASPGKLSILGKMFGQRTVGSSMSAQISSKAQLPLKSHVSSQAKRQSYRSTI